MPLEDYHRFDAGLQNELDKIDEVFHPDDQDAIRRFIRAKDGTVKTSTLLEYVRKIRQTAERVDYPLVELTEDRLNEHIFDLRRNPDYGRGDSPGVSDRTAFNVQHAVRMFAQFLDMEWADDYELIDFDTKTVDAEDMLLPEDVQALRKTADRLRDIALIEFLADSGARLSLAGTLRVGDVNLDSERPTYTPNPNAAGLKGADIKPYPIIDAAGVLRSYLRSTHPRPDRDDVALFHALKGEFSDEGDGAVGPKQIWRRLNDIGKDAGINKPTNPHNFRHSAITRMIREGYTRTEIEHRVQWKIDSDMWETYVHVTAEELNEDIFAHAGMGESEDNHDRVRHPCGNCGETLAPHHEFCPRCAAPVTKEKRDLFQQALTALGGGQTEAGDVDRRDIRAYVQRNLLEEGEPLDGDGSH